MKTITYVQGDATAPVGDGPKIITHVCNDIGGWGRGFVVALSNRWPEPEAAYRKWFAASETSGFELGAVRLVPVESDLWVANIVGQHDVRPIKGVPPVRYPAIEAGLSTVADEALTLGASVHMPRMGCGLAGGQWSEVEPIIERTLIATGIDVTVYDL